MKKILIITLLLLTTNIMAELPFTIMSLKDIPGNVSSVNENFKHLDWNKQDIEHKIYTTVPTTDDISEGQYVSYYDTSGNYRLYTKSNGNIVYTVLSIGDTTPVGTIITYVSTTSPTGYIYCNGQSVSTTTYSSLFGIIAYQYGGSTDTFTVPDYRGYFLRGMAQGSAIDPDRTARKRADGTYGDIVGSTQAYQIQSHKHTVNLGGEGGALYNYEEGSAADGVADDARVGNTGGNETRPSNIYVAYHIKY